LFTARLSHTGTVCQEQAWTALNGAKEWQEQGASRTETILRDYIKATVGFEKLGRATGAPPKSLIRMFGPRGNPQARNLFSVIGYLQKRAGVRLHVTS